MTKDTQTPAAVLMDVLTRMDAPAFRAQVDAEERPDGIRPPLWEVRYAAAHLASGVGPESWLDELEHSQAHVMSAGTYAELRAALVQHAALTAAWIQDLDGRES